MKVFFAISVLLSSLMIAQTIENTQNLRPFAGKIKSNTQVSNVLFIGDSHIQAGYITEVLREHFQNQYGNAGRGLVFPYQVANSKGPQDFTSISNQAWQTFRSVYDQDVFKEVGALGFVMGNHVNSLLEIDFKNTRDSFDQVVIYQDSCMNGGNFSVYDSAKPLADFVSMKRTIKKYTAQEGETYPELAAKFNVVTTRLLQLNGSAITNPKAGRSYKVENAEPVYNVAFEENIRLLTTQKFTGNRTTLYYENPTQKFLLKVNSGDNIFYGFQFLKRKATRGIVFNTVGVNGATYKDFLKYPLQIQQLRTTNPDLLIISLGTNESVSSISKDDFFKNVQQLISAFRNQNKDLPILIISPTDNNMNSQKVAEVVQWLTECSINNNTAFLNMYKTMGGKGYFSNAQKSGKAQSDGVHFLPRGYNEQGEKIWIAIKNYLDEN